MYSFTAATTSRVCRWNFLSFPTENLESSDRLLHRIVSRVNPLLSESLSRKLEEPTCFASPPRLFPSCSFEYSITVWSSFVLRLLYPTAASFVLSSNRVFSRSEVDFRRVVAASALETESLSRTLSPSFNIPGRPSRGVGPSASSSAGVGWWRCVLNFS